MLFTIVQKLFLDDNIDTISLNQILSTCIYQHTFYLNNLDDLEGIQQSSWYNSLNEINKKIFEESFTNSIQREDLSNKIKVSIGNSHTALEAIHYLNSPLNIILENSHNDSHFLKKLFACFKSESKLINKHIENRWVRFIMGGGSSIKQVIETEMDSFNFEHFPKANMEYLRCFVLLDSDKEHIEAPLKTGTRNLIEFLTDNGVPYHILEKREMENYIPDIAFINTPNNRNFIDAYLRLSNKQKDYFDLEKGFNNRSFDKLPKDLQDFYSTVNEQDRTIFRKNNMKKFTGKNEDNFKSECPKLFNLECVNKESLINRTRHQQNPNELKDIILKIRDLL